MNLLRVGGGGRPYSKVSSQGMHLSSSPSILLSPPVKKKKKLGAEIIIINNSTTLFVLAQHRSVVS